MAQTAVQTFDTPVTAPALVERVQIIDAAGNVLSTTTAPLPAGSATAARQDAAKAVLDALLTALQGTLTTSVANFPSTQAVSLTGTAAVSPVDPTGASVTRDGSLLTNDRHLRRLLEEILLTLQNQNSILLGLGMQLEVSP